MTGNQWEDWLEAIECEFRYFRTAHAEDKKDALLICGEKITRLEKSLNDEPGERMNEYHVLRNKLNKYFLPKKNNTSIDMCFQR